jgi:hypothetical protein
MCAWLEMALSGTVVNFRPFRKRRGKDGHGSDNMERVRPVSHYAAVLLLHGRGMTAAGYNDVGLGCSGSGLWPGNLQRSSTLLKRLRRKADIVSNHEKQSAGVKAHHSFCAAYGTTKVVP